VATPLVVAPPLVVVAPPEALEMLQGIHFRFQT
jgi:hypothetical protein